MDASGAVPLLIINGCVDRLLDTSDVTAPRTSLSLDLLCSTRSNGSVHLSDDTGPPSRFVHDVIAATKSETSAMPYATPQRNSIATVGFVSIITAPLGGAFERLFSSHGVPSPYSKSHSLYAIICHVTRMTTRVFMTATSPRPAPSGYIND